MSCTRQNTNAIGRSRCKGRNEICQGAAELSSNLAGSNGALGGGYSADVRFYGTVYDAIASRVGQSGLCSRGKGTVSIKQRQREKRDWETRGKYCRLPELCRGNSTIKAWSQLRLYCWDANRSVQMAKNR